MTKETVEGWHLTWRTVVLVAVLVGMVAEFSKGNDYCRDFPEDNVTCQCTNWMVAHIRFWDEFNDTTPDILEMIRNNTYQERLRTTTVASIIGEKLLISNITPQYSVFYNYEIVPRRCLEAVKKVSKKPKYEKIEVKPSYNGS